MKELFQLVRENIKRIHHPSHLLPFLYNIIANLNAKIYVSYSIGSTSLKQSKQESYKIASQSLESAYTN